MRIALVGAGWVSTNRHAPALAANDRVHVVGVVAPADALERLPRSLTGLRHATDFAADWFADVDAVVIGTPPTTHADLVGDALRLDKHVLVEKPLTLTSDDADAVIALAEQRQRSLGVVHNLQYSRAATQARAALASGSLGELRGVIGLQSSNHRRRLPAWYPSLPLGLYTDEAPHLLYLAESFAGPTEIEQVTVGQPLGPGDNTPDVVAVSLRDAHGRPVTILQNFTGALSEWALVLLGSRGTAVIDLFRDVLLVLPDDGSHLARDVLRTSRRGVVGHLSGVVGSGWQRLRGRLDYGNDEVIRRFVGSIVNGDDLAGISAEHGRRVVQTIEACHLAARRA